MATKLIQLEIKPFTSDKWILAHAENEGFLTLDDAIKWAHKNIKGNWRFKN